MSDIKNQYGEVIYRLEGNRINDKYGEWKYEIRDNYIYDRYGARQFEIKGEYLYDTSGSRLGEVKDLAVLLGDTGESGGSGGSSAPSSGGSSSSRGTSDASSCLGCVGCLGTIGAILLRVNRGGIIGAILGVILSILYSMREGNWIASQLIIGVIYLVICHIAWWLTKIFKLNIGGKIGAVFPPFLLIVLILFGIGEWIIYCSKWEFVLVLISSIPCIFIGHIIGWLVKKITKKQ